MTLYNPMNWAKFKKEYFRGFYSYWRYCANWLVALSDFPNLKFFIVLEFSRELCSDSAPRIRWTRASSSESLRYQKSIPSNMIEVAKFSASEIRSSLVQHHREPYGISFAEGQLLFNFAKGFFLISASN